MERSVSTKEAPGTEKVEAAPERLGGRLLPLPEGDIRSGRPYLLSEGPLRTFARRLGSVAGELGEDLFEAGFFGGETRHVDA